MDFVGELAKASLTRRGKCYPVCEMMHIKEPMLLIGKSSPCGGGGFPLSLSEWSFTICMTPYNRKYNVLSASLNKTFPSFLLSHNQCFSEIFDVHSSLSP